MALPVDWYPHTGDPTVIGWTITVVYFVVMFLCYKAGMAAKRKDSGARRISDSALWFALAGMLLALGINKQLDLQTLLITLGRQMARLNGWYDLRREVQFGFVVVLAIFGVLSMIALSWWTAGQWRRYWPVLIGVTLLIIFVLIRSASFNSVDYFLGKWRVIGPFSMKYVVELAGVLVVGLAALRDEHP